MMSEDLRVIPIKPSDRQWLTELLVTRWGGPEIITQGVVHRADRCKGFVAWAGGQRVGALTLVDAGDGQVEITSLDSLDQGRGVGTALVGAVRALASLRGCFRVWLITTNDNLGALRFWQRRGFDLVSVHRGAIAESRRLKPLIPMVGAHGIPIRHEVELEACMSDAGDSGV